MWFALSEALQVPLRVEFGRDRLEEPADAGHLAIQELILRIGRAAGFGRTFELPTRPANPRLSVDVCLRDDARRLFVLVEAWNSFGDIGASVRGTNRKIAEAHALAVAVGGDGWYRVAACWVVRDTARNRELAARYRPKKWASSGAMWRPPGCGRGVDPRAYRSTVAADVDASQRQPEPHHGGTCHTGRPGRDRER